MTNRRAAIVGAGIGGLATALALRQIGFEITVFEQAEQFGPAGAGIVLWPNALAGLRSLEISDALVQVGQPVTSGQVRTDRGRILTSSDLSRLARLAGQTTLAFHRAELHETLRGGLPGDVVRLGARVVGLDDDGSHVVVHFADGRTESADLVVGADGLHSVVRSIVNPSVRLRYSGYTSWRAVVTNSLAGDLPGTTESWGRGARFGVVPLSQSRVYWFATENAVAGELVPPARRRDHLLSVFGHWHPPIASLLESTPAEAIIQTDISDVIPFRGWSRGRVVLLGDAAHPTTPNLGQGAAMAIESAVALRDALVGRDDVGPALADYERRRWERAAYITNRSWQLGRMGQITNPVLRALRNLTILMTPAGVAERELRRVAAISR